MTIIGDNIKAVLQQVRLSALKVNRDPSEIGIVTVTKTVTVDKINEAVSVGLKVLGENRVQELIGKYPQIDGVEWHLIGHLQSNKIKYITDKVTLIHSLDSLSLAEELNKRMLSINSVMNVLVQVNISGETTKFGVALADASSFTKAVSKLPGIKVKGLMTIAPYADDPEDVRYIFRHLRKLAEEIKIMDIPGIEMQHLSMGMSNDYRVAIEEGATLIRLGSTIFGQRNYEGGQ